MAGVNVPNLDWEDKVHSRDGIPKTMSIHHGLTMPVRDFFYVREKQNYFLLKLGFSVLPDTWYEIVFLSPKI